MAIEVQITLNGRKIRGDQPVTFDVPGALVAGARAIQEGIKEVFATDNFGNWPAHKKSTIQRYGEHPILRLNEDDEGSLYNRLLSSEAIKQVGARRVEVGLPGVTKYVVHMTGTAFMPARPMIDVSTKAEDNTIEAMANALLKSFPKE